MQAVAVVAVSNQSAKYIINNWKVNAPNFVVQVSAKQLIRDQQVAKPIEVGYVEVYNLPRLVRNMHDVNEWRITECWDAGSLGSSLTERWYIYQSTNTFSHSHLHSLTYTCYCCGLWESFAKTQIHFQKYPSHMCEFGANLDCERGRGR